MVAADSPAVGSFPQPMGIESGRVVGFGPLAALIVCLGGVVLADDPIIIFFFYERHGGLDRVDGFPIF